MNGASCNLSLGEAVSRFLASLPAEERKVNQPEVYKFARWYGWGRPFTELTAPQVAKYAEWLSSSETDYIKKHEVIRAFLVYAKKEGWTKTNLATHLKTKKGKVRMWSSAGRSSPETTSLTQEGYAEMEAELAALKSKRPQLIDEIRRAAADKDVRENVPLEAAREQYGQLEGRIKEIEQVLKSAVVIGEKQKATLKAAVGDSVVLCDLASGEELHYKIVSPREVDPTRGKISSASPLGKAIISRGQGEMVEVQAPVGKLRYQIKQVEH